MTQTIAAGVDLGPAHTGEEIGYRILNLDLTSYSAFSTTGVSETTVLGTYTKSGGAVAPDEGGYIVWGILGTDYIVDDIAPASSTAAQIDTQLSGTHGAGSWATATGFATPTNVSDAQTALSAAIAALNNLSQVQAQTAAAAALTAYDPPTKAELDTAQAAIVAAIPSATDAAAAVMAYALESGKTMAVAMLDVWAVIVGDSSANDDTDPTTITYDSPDSSVQITHTLTSTSRTVA